VIIDVDKIYISKTAGTQVIVKFVFPEGIAYRFVGSCYDKLIEVPREFFEQHFEEYRS
jgi:hypothetical protein